MQIKTTTGIVQGYEKDDMMVFMGIPYAEAPLGELRWKRALQKKPWEGVLAANRKVPCSLQVSMGEIIGSEDCLYLNIKCPKDINPAAESLPVLFWIHGGGYNTGMMDDEIADGSAFVRDGLIFVEIQYRLNLLGFFDFGIIPGCEFIESNRGLSDMITAIKWMHDNIAAFGGNPNRVTIMGESAGGAAVTTLMAVPAVKGMFSQVIAESSLPNCVQTHETAKTLLYAYMKENGRAEKDMPALLKGEMKPLILAAEYVQHESQKIDPGTFLPCPVIDDLLPVHPMKAVAEGSAEGIRLILGTNLHEGTMFINDFMHIFPDSWEMLETMFQNHGHEERFANIRQYYDHDDERYPGEISPFVNFATDYAFHVPGIEFAELQSHYGDVYLYTYEFVAEGARRAKMLASHAFEMAFVFETYDTRLPKGTLSDTPIEIKEELCRQMHGSWVSFIRGNVPHKDWPKMAGYSTDVRIFDVDTMTRHDDLRPLMELWKELRFF